MGLNVAPVGSYEMRAGMRDTPVKFADGSYYCDCGKQLEKSMFWFFHKDKSEHGTNCHRNQTLAEIREDLYKLP